MRARAVHLAGALCLVARYPVLAGVDLDVAEGEIVLVSGPNGAGKTSLLRLLAGLVPLTAGTAEVLGHDLADGGQRRALRRHLAYLGHDTGCYDDLSVRDNLRFAARAVGRADAREAADDVIATVGLARQARVAHRRLSAGQKRRLALGVALVRDARLLLLDEPHAGLDADGRDLLEDLARAAAADGPHDRVLVARARSGSCAGAPRGPHAGRRRPRHRSSRPRGPRRARGARGDPGRPVNTGGRAGAGPS